MIPRRKCEICGSSIDPDTVRTRKRAGKSIICRNCIDVERALQRAYRIVLKKEALSKKTCVICGGPIPWKDMYDRKSEKYWPETCSPYCHGVKSRAKYRYTKEYVENKLKEYLLQVGHPCTHDQALHGSHLASKVLTKLGVSILAVQKELFGLQVDRVHADINQVEPITAPELQDLVAKYGIDACSYAEFCDKVITKHETDNYAITPGLVEDLYLSYIGHVGHYVPKVVIIKGLFHDKWAVRNAAINIDSISINWKMGYRDPKRSWYEIEAGLYLRKLFGHKNVSAEHTFTDCRSNKNFPLRFDFYVPYHRLLVEIDGEQHTDKNNAFYTEQLAANDRIKKDYAEQNGYTLVRVPTMPRFTFTSRLEKAIMDVVKPAELLEPLTENAEGNQQPRSDDEFDVQPDLGF